ncbi:MAG: endonuclease/exonuclease/phosphatase family protein [Bacteroidales bacterium]|nr:endonuclease/exonuclease/phosphatase family protein [Bacteroidales bacterium]
MKRTGLIILFTLLIWGLTQAQSIQNRVNIGFYNVENLFDTINDPNKNDEQFLPEGDYQWTSEKYLLKLKMLSQVISDMAQMPGGLAILGVSEVENESVLRDLIATELLAPYKLEVCHHESPDRRGVDVSFIYNPSRFKVLSTKAFPLIFPENPDFITRDQWLMTGILDGEDTLHVIVNHWPSKSGGEKRSLPYRLGAGKLARYIADSIMNASPNAKIVIMGDLNDNPNSKSLMECLRTRTNTKDLAPNDLYNPMWQMYRNGVGSYAYRDSWELIDNIIVSAGLVNPVRGGYKFFMAHIFRKDYLLTKSGSYTNYPWRMYAGGIYQGGYSDHLPVYITLTK